MNGKKANRLRKEAYRLATVPGNHTEYRIKWFEKLTGKTGSDGKQEKRRTGTIFCTGYRRVYQNLKKEVMA